MQVFDVRNVVCGYGSREVLRDVSFSVSEGEFIAIVGPNGCGKTTLVRALSRILPLCQGSISIRGRDIWRLSPRELAREVACVPQLLETPFPYRVQEFVAMGRFPYLGILERPRQKDTDSMERAMNFFNVTHLADRNIRELSGGERQRVLLTQGLVQEPKVFLLDEPTAHLDINYQIEVCEHLRGLSREGVAVVAILHDLNFAAAYARRILVLKDGRLVSDGKPEDVLTARTVKEVFGADVHVSISEETGHPFIVPKQIS